MEDDEPSAFKQAELAIRALIEFIGDDPYRPGLLHTPQRVIKAWSEEWGAGYNHKSPDDLLRMFENTDDDDASAYNQMVVVRDISFHSHCEHHLTPFFGKAAIAYIPSPKGIVGLSKLARVVDHFASRLQVQERLSSQIADFLCAHLSPDCAVSLEATHLCMVSRGIKQPHATTITNVLRGAFYDDPTCRAEFLAAAKG